MSTEHNHPSECDHVLRYCKKCDVAYCTICGMEWGRSSVTWYPYYTISTGSTSTGDVGSRGTHAH